MRDPFARPANNWFLFVPLVLLSALFTAAGAFVAYGVFTEWLGYTGGKSGVIYLGGAVGGFTLTQPLWSLYRRRYPKT